MRQKIWIACLCFFMLFVILWISDSKNYDKDLEQDHYRESGLMWDDIENIERER